jgi:hypothetical protein
MDALPVVRAAPVRSVARAAGLGEADVRGALGMLELEGLAVQRDGGWVRRRPGAPVGTSTGGGPHRTGAGARHRPELSGGGP